MKTTHTVYQVIVTVYQVVNVITVYIMGVPDGVVDFSRS